MNKEQHDVINKRFQFCAKYRKTIYEVKFLLFEKGPTVEILDYADTLSQLRRECLYTTSDINRKLDDFEKILREIGDGTQHIYDLGSNLKTQADNMVVSRIWKIVCEVIFGNNGNSIQSMEDALHNWFKNSLTQVEIDCQTPPSLDDAGSSYGSTSTKTK